MLCYVIYFAIVSCYKNYYYYYYYYYYFFFFHKNYFNFFMFRDVPECSGMFPNVPGCSGMFRNVPCSCSSTALKSTLTLDCKTVRIFAYSSTREQSNEADFFTDFEKKTDCFAVYTYTHALKHKVTIAWEHCVTKNCLHHSD